MTNSQAFPSIVADEKAHNTHVELGIESAIPNTDIEPITVDGAMLDKKAYIRAQQLTLETRKPLLQAIKENKKAICIGACMQVAGTILGAEVIMVSALVGNQAFVRVMGIMLRPGTMKEFVALTPRRFAAISQPIGMFFGGWLADKAGRLPTMYLAPCIIYAGVVLELVSTNRWMFLGSKIVMGLAAGTTQSVFPAYVAEIAPREVRGILVGGGWSLFFNLGGFLATMVTYGGNKAYPDPLDNRGWKVPLYVGLSPPTITMIFNVLLLRESPYWLAMHNKMERAKRSLRFINPNKSEEEISELADQLSYTITKERKHALDCRDSTYFDLLRGPDLRRTFVACFPSAALQMAGNMMQSSYSTYFFTLAGITNALLGSSIVTMCGLLGAFAAFVLLEIVGRRPLVLVGLVVETSLMLIIGIVNSAQHGNITSVGGWVLVVCCAIFNFTSAMGPGVCGHSYAGEAGSVRLRAKTNAVALMMNGLLGGIWQTVLPYELDKIGPDTGYMFFGFGLICVTVAFFFLPELRGLTYAQMDELFARKIDSRKFQTTECTGAYGAASQFEERTSEA